MEGVLKERQLTPSQEEEMELREMAPEKFEQEFDPDFEFKVNKQAADPKKSDGYSTYTVDEVVKLLAASKAPHVPYVMDCHKYYDTYSKEQIIDLMTEHYQYNKKSKD